MFDWLKVALAGVSYGAILGLIMGLLSPLLLRGRRSIMAKRAKYGFWKAWGIEIGECVLGGMILGAVAGLVLFSQGEVSVP
jgi:hypothetical protein